MQQATRHCVAPQHSRTAMIQFPILTIAAPVTAVDLAALAQPRQFLTFKLDSQEYGIDILGVQEIRSFEPPLRIANAPAHLLGMHHLRGVIVPIVDLRIHFGLAGPVYDAFTVVTVLVSNGRVCGVVVDAVSDVIHLAVDHLLPLPAFNDAVPNDHLQAIGALGDCANVGERVAWCVAGDVHQRHRVDGPPR